MRPVVAITAAIPGGDLVRRVLLLADHGLHQVVLREPVSPDDLTQIVERVPVVTVHSRWSSAPPPGCGLHHRAHDRSVALHALTGVSCHTGEEVDEALRWADYALLSPIWRPHSKPNDRRTPLGPDRFIAVGAGRPVFALGGVTPRRWASLKARGAMGVAVCGPLMHPDPAQAVSFLQSILSV